MDHYDVIVAAAHEAKLTFIEHQKVGQALEIVAAKLNEAEADAKRVVQLTEELAAADEKADELEVLVEYLKRTLKHAGIDPIAAAGSASPTDEPAESKTESGE